MKEKGKSSRKTVSLSYTRGVEGNCVYLNGYRICGPKPWGGGTILAEWEVEIDDIKRAMLPHMKMARARDDIDGLAKELRDKVKAVMGRYRMRFFDGGTVIVNAQTKPVKRPKAKR